MKQLARVIIKLDDKQLNNEIAKKMPNPYHVTDKALQNGFKIKLDSHNINHAFFIWSTVPNYPEFGFETRHTSKIKKEIAIIHARIMNQYEFKHQTVFSAVFDEQGEDKQVLDETEMFIKSNNNHNLTESDLVEIDNKSQLEYQIQQQEMKEAG